MGHPAFVWPDLGHLHPAPLHGRVNGRMQDHAPDHDDSLTGGRRIGPNQLACMEQLASHGGEWSRSHAWSWGTVEQTERALQRLTKRGAVSRIRDYDQRGPAVYRINVRAILNASAYILPESNRTRILRALGMGWE